NMLFPLSFNPFAYLCSLFHSHPTYKHMIFFFQPSAEKIYALETSKRLTDQDIEKLTWLFGGNLHDQLSIEGEFVGPRKEMITPWSTSAVEITLNMGIKNVSRIEEFYLKKPDDLIDPMLQAVYSGLDQNIFHIDIQPEPVRQVHDIEAYSTKEGLALSPEEITYLEDI